jgi:hypothetical protein
VTSSTACPKRPDPSMLPGQRLTSGLACDPPYGLAPEPLPPGPALALVREAPEPDRAKRTSQRTIGHDQCERRPAPGAAMPRRGATPRPEPRPPPRSRCHPGFPRANRCQLLDENDGRSPLRSGTALPGRWPTSRPLAVSLRACPWRSACSAWACSRRPVSMPVRVSVAWGVCADVSSIPPIIPVVGYLNSISNNAEQLAAFRQGLDDLGFIEGLELPCSLPTTPQIPKSA